jgi:hypothetical protein
VLLSRCRRHLLWLGKRLIVDLVEHLDVHKFDLDERLAVAFNLDSLGSFDATEILVVAKVGFPYRLFTEFAAIARFVPL